jgi:formylglycine-generating enzyme
MMRRREETMLRQTDASAEQRDAMVDGMIHVPGGSFRMGSDRHYPEEAPAHLVPVDSFWIDRTPVTNRQFRAFVTATGYTTLAELTPEPNDYPGALPHMLKPGSLVYRPLAHEVDLRDWSRWWRFVFGANWRRPDGPHSSTIGHDDHPGDTRRLLRRGGLCRLGRQGATDGGRVGIRSTWRARGRGVRLGR